MGKSGKMQVAAEKCGGRFQDSATFARANDKCEWLVRGVLVRGQSGVLGSVKKCLKSSIAIDLAVSLGTGTPFLGRFEVPRRMRVAMVSGECNTAGVREVAQRVCKARKIRLDACDVLWSFRAIRLGSVADVDSLRCDLIEARAEVVIIDPLYVSLHDGSTGCKPDNFFEAGMMLGRFGEACREAGVTPLLVHHMNQSSGYRSVPLDLDVFPIMGVSEFVRQWVLVKRRRAYQSGTGLHCLRLDVGGSAGHSGAWDIDIDEGVVDRDLGGRTWSVGVFPAGTRRDNAKRGVALPRGSGQDLSGLADWVPA